VVADLLRGAGWEVVDLGADVPAAEFIVAVEKAAPVSVVAIGVTNPAAIEDARNLVVAMRSTVEAPIIVGGTAINAATAAHIGSDAWASDGRTAVVAVEAIGG
jgi:5-methyltetrahydrofolate--homocysteine methyltransferase